MAENNRGQRRRVRRQQWKPGRFLLFLKGLWTLFYSVFKIALAAVATVIVIGAVCLFVFLGVLGDYLENDVLPNADAELERFLQNQNSYAYYVDGNGNIQQLQKIYADVEQQWASIDEIPDAMKYAAVAIEDHRFYEHQGVDWVTTIKAFANMFLGSRSQFGGSSITQQLIKNYFKEDDVTVQRKVLEIFRATELEKRYDKDTIMEFYLNIIFLGNRCNGVKSASATYFGKELEYLTPAECACIISITNNPSLYNPYRTRLDSDGLTGLEQNDIRRTNTLYMMRNYGYLTEEEYQEALNQELVFKRGIDPEDKNADCNNEGCGYHGTVGTFELRDDGIYYCPKCGQATNVGTDASQEVYSWFMDTVLEDVAQAYAKKIGVDWDSMKSQEKRDFISMNIAKAGFHIYTTFNAEAQKAVDDIYQDLSKIPTGQSPQQLQSGIVVIDNRTGDIVAMAGGVGADKGFDDWNCATDAHRQPGSSLKPLSVYAPGFELGIINPASVAVDLPIRYIDDGKSETGRPFPYNDNRRYSYSRTILSALVSSVNAVAVNTLNNIGHQYSFNFAKYQFGISTLVESYVNSQGTVFTDIDDAPLALGAPSDGVTVRDMAAAYATFANNGVYRTARTFTKVYDRDGNLVLDNTQESKQILSNKTVNYINYCLDEAVDRGTGRLADLKNIGIDVCGKTGSTASNKDRWFCGYTNHFTAAVWTGYLTPEDINLTGIYRGINPAAYLWNKVMAPLHTGLTSHKMYSERDMKAVRICLDCGKLATDACSLDARLFNGNAETTRVDTALVYPEDAPLEDCDCHVIVDFCESCNAVANAYCKKLAAVGKATIVKRSLTRITEGKLEDIINASKNNLYPMHCAENYIYLVDRNGSPASYYGFDGQKNEGLELPYLVASGHTREDWEAFVRDHPEYGDNTQDPDSPIEEET